MTHSLHRRGDVESLKEDFVVLACPSTGINKDGSAPRTRDFLSICYKHGPINLGDMKTGNIYNTTMDDILANVTDGTVVQCTFDNRDKIVALMKKPRNRYINEAIDYYNKHQQRVMLERKIQYESESVKENSMNILREFEDFEYGD